MANDDDVPQDKWDQFYSELPYLDDPEPILRIPGFDITVAEGLRLVLPKQVLSEETQRQIWEEVGERCVICFAVSPYSEGGRALPLLHRMHVKFASSLQLIPDNFSVDCKENGIWLCQHCFPMMLSSQWHAMAVSFFLPAPVLRYIRKQRKDRPYTPVYQILRALECQPSLDDDAFALLGKYKLRPARPSARKLMFPQVPSFIIHQASDGHPHTYDTKTATCTPTLAEGPRNQFWNIHRSPAIILAFLFARVRCLFYDENEGDYIPAEECIESATLYRALLLDSVREPVSVSPPMAGVEMARGEMEGAPPVLDPMVLLVLVPELALITFTTFAADLTSFFLSFENREMYYVIQISNRCLVNEDNDTY
ncbi:hypothetical protein VNI00_005152 [Paramarasmius palmivorus]|uniref:HNH nuclease domain-containing protein n=1 Tax=Paramarasmius palmivorus TaxID=297713 RepID=A0AAW0DIS4_9AGAR